MAAEYMRQKLASFTETVFTTRPTQEKRQHHMVRPGNELVTSLPLQIALYFDGFFFPFWIAMCLVVLQVKLSSLDELSQFISFLVYFIMTGNEIMRLYLGYLGNLQERVPELAGFWLLTLVLQLPLCGFLFIATTPTPPEIAVHLVFIIFLLTEIICGFFALKAISRHQIMKFHLQQFDEFLDVGTPGYQPLT